MTAEAEAVLGAAILGAEAHPSILALGEDDFEDSRHRLVAAVLRDMIRTGKPITDLTVNNEIEARGQMSKAGGVGSRLFVMDLARNAPVPSSASYYARVVRQQARHRLLAGAVADMAGKVGMDQAVAEFDALLEWHRHRLAEIPGPLNDGPGVDRTLTALLNEQEDPDEPIIPGLLYHQERVVLTGGEGMAKSTLWKQFTVCVAAGLHPWTGVRVADGHRVLHIDAENSRAQNRRNYRWIASRCNRGLMADGWSDRIHHYVRNDGIDLPGRDAGWLHQICAEVSPDLIVLGPAYKLMRGDPQKDRDVMALLNVLDEVRVRHNAAMLIEHHSPHQMDGPHRTVRPYGSSVWLRWPEVGIGLRRDMAEGVKQERRPEQLEVRDWRGARDERDWPNLIRFGKGRGELPWWPTGEYRTSVDANYSMQDQLSKGA